MQNHINTLVAKLTRSYKILNERLMNDVGLHPGQAQVLSVLWATDGLSQAEIVRQLHVSSPTVNSLVSKLVDNKFVKCKKCPQDKRLLRVFLTKKGSEMRSQAEQQWQKLEVRLFQDFSDTEKILVLMLLEKAKNNLQKDLC